MTEPNVFKFWEFSFNVKINLNKIISVEYVKGIATDFVKFINSWLGRERIIPFMSKH